MRIASKYVVATPVFQRQKIPNRVAFSTGDCPAPDTLWVHTENSHKRSAAAELFPRELQEPLSLQVAVGTCRVEGYAGKGGQAALLQILLWKFGFQDRKILGATLSQR